MERDKVINKNFNLNTTITNLTNEKNSVQNSLKGQYKDIVIHNSGYFVNNIDNFENKINIHNISSLTPQQIVDFINTPDIKKNYSVLGKIIKDYKWKYIMLIDKISIKDVKIGTELNLLFDGDERNAIPAKISKMVEYKDKMLVYLDSEYLNENTVEFRTSYAQVIIKRYRGIKIDASALRIKNGEKGVYVRTTIGKQFKKIEPIFSDDKYIICKQNMDNDEYLRAYDEVIIN